MGKNNCRQRGKIVDAGHTKPDKYSEAAKELLENRLLTPQDLEKEYGISTKTLANWRSQGKGPAYFKLGNSIRYRGGYEVDCRFEGKDLQEKEALT